MIKSPLRYPGGKTRALKFISEHIPQDFKEYREPFLGGASVLFYVKQKNPGKIYFANDLNYELMCFWSHLNRRPKELIQEVISLKSRFNTYTSVNSGKDLYNILMQRRFKTDDFTRASDFFVLNRITFSGLCDSGGFSKEAFLKRFTDSSIERLRKASKVIKDVYLSSVDYKDLIESPGDSVFVFCDPPYYTQKKSKLYGVNGNLHDNFNHKRLKLSIDASPHKILLTYDDCEYIRELYSDYEILDFSFNYSMTKAPKKGNEILIKNF